MGAYIRSRGNGGNGFTLDSKNGTLRFGSQRSTLKQGVKLTVSKH